MFQDSEVISRLSVKDAEEEHFLYAEGKGTIFTVSDMPVGTYVLTWYM